MQNNNYLEKEKKLNGSNLFLSEDLENIFYDNEEEADYKLKHEYNFAYFQDDDNFYKTKLNTFSLKDDTTTIEVTTTSEMFESLHANKIKTISIEYSLDFVYNINLKNKKLNFCIKHINDNIYLVSISY